MSSIVIENTSLDLAIKIAKMCQALQTEGRSDIVAERLLNSCVAVGVFIRDYEQAENNNDINKYLNLALSELKFTNYWLDLMHETGVISYEDHENLLQEFINLDTGIKEMMI